MGAREGRAAGCRVASTVMMMERPCFRSVRTADVWLHEDCGVIIASNVSLDAFGAEELEALLLEGTFGPWTAR